MTPLARPRIPSVPKYLRTIDDPIPCLEKAARAPLNHQGLIMAFRST
jgi:hypothetical protein